MRQLSVRLAFLSVFFLSLTHARGDNPPKTPRWRGLDAAFADLEDGYPSTRIWGSLVSMLTGGASFVGGTLLAFDGARPTDEAIAAYALATLGAVDGIDGMIRFGRRSSAELALPHYKSFPAGKPAAYGGDKDKVQWGEETLARLADEARTERFLRGALDILTAGCYLYLNHKGDVSFDASGQQSGNRYYKYLVYPAAFLALVGVYRILFTSPEERALARYRETGRGDRAGETDPVAFFITPTTEGALAGMALRF